MDTSYSQFRSSGFGSGTLRAFAARDHWYTRKRKNDEGGKKGRMPVNTDEWEEGSLLLTRIVVRSVLAPDHHHQQ